jgi:hypothetical protein
MRPISTIHFFVASLFAAALLLGLTGAAFAGGYQRTEDGKALVWNNDPKPNDEATWSGGRDEQGYATGAGTLAWYRKQQKLVTGSNLLAKKTILISRYTGEMKHGKLDGAVVAVDASGKTYHGQFVDGHKERWVAGAAEKEQPFTERRTARRAEPLDAPAEGPTGAAVRSTEAKPRKATAGSADGESAQSAEPDARGAASSPTSKQAEFDDSLKSLVGPPPALHQESRGEASDATAATPASSAPSKPQKAEKPGGLDISAGAKPDARATASPRP